MYKKAKYKDHKYCDMKMDEDDDLYTEQMKKDECCEKMSSGLNSNVDDDKRYKLISNIFDNMESRTVQLSTFILEEITDCSCDYVTIELIQSGDHYHRVTTEHYLKKKEDNKCHD